MIHWLHVSAAVVSIRRQPALSAHMNRNAAGGADKPTTPPYTVPKDHRTRLIAELEFVQCLGEGGGACVYARVGV